MPPRVELEPERDFTGGLNLATDPYNLAPDESPDLLNVDIDRRGGFSIRRGNRAFINTAVPATGVPNGTPDSSYTYVTPAGQRQLIVARERLLHRWDGAAWIQIAPQAASGATGFVEMRNNLYCTKGFGTQVGRWNGTTFTNLPSGPFNDNLAAPVGGVFPACFTAAVHNDVMFAGNLFDFGVSAGRTTRLRWSHPLTAEDWRTNDFIDIDPDDENGDITAVVPFGDRLIVFKNHAVYAVSGYPPEGFSVTAISKSVGVENQWAVCKSENRIWFFDRTIGLCEFDGRKITWPFERLYPLIDDGIVNRQFLFQTAAAYFNRRVYLTVFWAAPPFQNKTMMLVYAPDVGRNGAWTLNTTVVAPFTMHVHDIGKGEERLLAGEFERLYEIDVENFYEDQTWTAGVPSTKRINALYQTRWFDAKNPALRKRWKRPIVVVGADANQEFKVDVLDDYNPSVVRRTFSLFTDVNGVEGVWDVSNWDQVLWAAEIGDRSQVLRGSPLGTGTAKALRFSNVAQGVDWRIHGVTMKWVPKRIRN